MKQTPSDSIKLIPRSPAQTQSQISQGRQTRSYSCKEGEIQLEECREGETSRSRHLSPLVLNDCMGKRGRPTYVDMLSITMVLFVQLQR